MASSLYSKKQIALQLPPKKFFIYDMMNKLLDTLKEKGIPFSFLVRDLPRYKLIYKQKTRINSWTLYW